MAIFRILESTSKYKLEEQVQDLLHRGFKLHGILFMSRGNDWYCQAMYKETEYDSNGEPIKEFTGFDVDTAQVKEVETKTTPTHKVTPESVYDDGPLNNAWAPDWMRDKDE